jgi:hypothetical protein
MDSKSTRMYRMSIISLPSKGASDRGVKCFGYPTLWKPEKATLRLSYGLYEGTTVAMLGSVLPRQQGEPRQTGSRQELLSYSSDHLSIQIPAMVL